MLAALVALALAAAAAAEKKGGLPQLNASDFAPQLFWLALTFGLLYLLLARIALPRIGSVIEERQGRIQRDLDEAERLKGETEKALANYEAALAEARGKANGIARGMRDKLTAEVEAERARIERQAAAKIAEAEARISQTKAKARAEVDEIAAETAEAIVDKLIGRGVSTDEVRRAVKAVAGE